MKSSEALQRPYRELYRIFQKILRKDFIISIMCDDLELRENLTGHLLRTL